MYVPPSIYDGRTDAFPPAQQPKHSPLTHDYHCGKRASCVSSATTTSLLVAHHQAHSHPHHPNNHQHHHPISNNMHNRSVSSSGAGAGVDCSVVGMAGGQEYKSALQLMVPQTNPQQPPLRQVGGLCYRRRHYYYHCHYKLLLTVDVGMAYSYSMPWSVSHAYHIVELN